MSLADYQKDIDDSLKHLKKPYWAPMSQLARLTEEVGEVARILNNDFGDKPKKPGDVHEKLEDELADVLYAVFCIANAQNIQLDEPFQKAINKIKTRDSERFEKK